MTSFKDWPTKADVSFFTGLSARTIERLTQDGKLKQAYVKVPGRRPLAVYDPQTVDELKRETIQQASPASDISRHIATSEPGLTDVLRLAATLLRIAIAERRSLVTIVEASLLTGLPKAQLRAAVRSGKLPSIRARATLVPRAELGQLVPATAASEGDRPMIKQEPPLTKQATPRIQQSSKRP